MENNEWDFRNKIKKVKESPRAVKIAKEEGVYIGDGRFYNFLFAFFIISMIILLSLFIFLIYDGKFQSLQEITLKPLYNTTTNNEYNNQFDNQVNNDYKFNPENNYTIYVNNFVECGNNT